MLKMKTKSDYIVGVVKPPNMTAIPKSSYGLIRLEVPTVVTMKILSSRM